MQFSSFTMVAVSKISAQRKHFSVCGLEKLEKKKTHPPYISIQYFSKNNNIKKNLVLVLNNYILILNYK